MDSAVSTAPDHPDLVVRKFQGATKARRLTAIAGVSPPADLRAYNNNIASLERAVKERVFFVKLDGKFTSPPKPLSRELFFARMDKFSKLLAAHLPSTVPVMRHQFVDRYRGRKRVNYQKALDSLNVKEFSFKDSYIKTFTKYEKTLFSSVKDPVPRVVSPRSLRYNIELGRFLSPIEERIFRAIGKVMGENTVMKGMNARDSARAIVAKWHSFRDPVAVGGDASRFDQHISVEALQWEHGVYTRCFPVARHKARLSSLLKMQLKNRCFGNVGDGSVEFTTNGVRMSGDMNTSLGNCVLMTALTASYADEIGCNVLLANNGDDCVYFMEREDLDKFMSGITLWFREMGFTMVMEDPVYEIEQISFCQTSPVWVGPDAFDYIMVRDPRVAIAKDTISVHPLDNSKQVYGWLNAVGSGGLSLTGSLPVWQAFYKMYLDSASGQKCSSTETGWGWGVRQLGANMHRSEGPILPKTRASFFLAFGISPEEQICIENKYSSTIIGGVLDVNVPFFTILPY